MNRPLRFVSALILVSAFGLPAVAGPLDPPKGPITSTYKTLTEVEPRIAVSAENTPGDATYLYRLTTPGSYYLTGNITVAGFKSGILISSRVTLDLNGFVIQGTEFAADGIRVNASSGGAVIRNGTIYSFKDTGIDAGESQSTILENITAQFCGKFGIDVGSRCIVTRCFVQGCASGGFRSFEGGVFTDCAAYTGGARGFDCGPDVTLINCQVNATPGYGIRCEPGAKLFNCTVSESGSSGFFLAGTATVTACSSRDNALHGFAAQESATLSDCTAEGNASGGFVGTARSRFTRCTSRGNVVGFYGAEGNTFVECTSAHNTAYGVQIQGNANTVERSNMHENSDSGLFIQSGVGNNIDGNLCTYNTGYGIEVGAGDNLVVRNRARGNTQGNYSFAANADYGVILTNPGQGFTSSAAWANFAY